MGMDGWRKSGFNRRKTPVGVKMFVKSLLRSSVVNTRVHCVSSLVTEQRNDSH